MLQNTFRGKRVLVTGDTGFKGSWLSVWLHELGANVVGYALPPERGNDHFNLLALNRIIHHVDGDIRDYSSFKQVVNDFQPQFIFHLAAQSLVRLSYDEPKLTFDTNAAGSVNVLEACRTTASVRVLIFVTSDKCYRNQEWTWGYRENDELGGHDPYSASKAAAELIFSGYLDSYFAGRAHFGAASVRAGNVIGGGDWAEDRIVPDSIKALQKNAPIPLRNPHATRPWQHVLEPLSGYLLLAQKLNEEPKIYSGAWNFGPSSDAIHTVRDLAEKIVSCWGNGAISETKAAMPPHEARLLRLNCDKAHQLLGWRPRWAFYRAISETVRWYLEVTAGTPAYTITKKQIRDYAEEGA
ncbi:MAG: CDP-glucose 4,6-dehydratase [Burkholderiales bacterium]